MFGIIYMVRHIASGRLYVGQTICGLKERWRQHVKSALTETGKKRTFFHNAIRKYGAEAFKTDVLETSGSREALNEAEKRWIATLNTAHPYGFNLTYGGDASDPTSKSRQNLSAARKRVWAAYTPEQRRRGWDSLGPKRQKAMIERIVSLRLSKETFEDRSAKMKSIWANKTLEERETWHRAVVAGLLRNHSAAERSETAKRAAALPEVKAKRGKAIKEAWSKKTPEHRSQIAAKGLAGARAKLESMAETEKAEFYARRAATLRATWAKRKAEEAQ